MRKIKVGFVGLGLMGLPMAKNILKNNKGPECAFTVGGKTYSKEDLEQYGELIYFMFQIQLCFLFDISL